MIYRMDQDYTKRCREYIKLWIKERNVEHYGITDDVIEYIITKGGDGLRELERCFIEVIETAEEYQVEVIDKSFIDKVFH